MTAHVGGIRLERGAGAAAVEATPRPARGAGPGDGAPRPGLQVLSAGDPPATEMRARLEEIAALPFVADVLALPDLHLKPDMEVPSSLAITTVGTLVPEFTSVAVNDGMGAILTDLDARDLGGGRGERLLTSIGRHAAAHPLDANRYSLDATAMLAAMEHGARGVLDLYGLEPGLLERVESGGGVPVPAEPGPWRDAAPRWLWGSRLGRSEMGLNFGGNHFLEVQQVDEVLDRRVAGAEGLERGRVVVMFHLGPGPFGGTLLHHYSRRRKLSPARAPFMLLSRALLHARRRHRRPWREVWRDHFRSNGWTALAEGSEGGLAFRQALALAVNVGFAYRMATVAAIRDGLMESVSPLAAGRLLCDVSHNLLREEPWGRGRAWVARHNACPLAPGRLTIVAGAHDVPTMLAIGGHGAEPSLHSHDHGAGHVIAAWRREGRLAPAGARTVRLRMSRGRAADVRERDELPVRDSGPLDAVMECLESRGILRPVVRLRPLCTLKN